MNPNDVFQNPIEATKAEEAEELDIELVGAIEEVTYGWVGYTYDVTWGDRHP